MKPPFTILTDSIYPLCGKFTGSFSNRCASLCLKSSSPALLFICRMKFPWLGLIHNVFYFDVSLLQGPPAITRTCPCPCAQEQYVTAVYWSATLRKAEWLENALIVLLKALAGIVWQVAGLESTWWLLNWKTQVICLRYSLGANFILLQKLSTFSLKASNWSVQKEISLT